MNLDALPGGRDYRNKWAVLYVVARRFFDPREWLRTPTGWEVKNDLDRLLDKHGLEKITMRQVYNILDYWEEIGIIRRKKDLRRRKGHQKVFGLNRAKLHLNLSIRGIELAESVLGKEGGAFFFENPAPTKDRGPFIGVMYDDPEKGEVKPFLAVDRVVYGERYGGSYRDVALPNLGFPVEVFLNYSFPEPTYVGAVATLQGEEEVLGYSIRELEGEGYERIRLELAPPEQGVWRFTLTTNDMGEAIPALEEPPYTSREIHTPEIEILEPDLWGVESSTHQGWFYHLDPGTGCTCPAYRYDLTRPCKHMDAVKKVIHGIRKGRVDPSSFKPARRIGERLKAYWRSEIFKSNILTEGDFVDIQGRRYVKLSGWIKYALACDISTKVISEGRHTTINGNLVCYSTVRAETASGRRTDAGGVANEEENPIWDHREHDIRTLSQIRAFNRAISDLVAAGEPSAEEVPEYMPFYNADFPRWEFYSEVLVDSPDQASP